MKVVKALIAFGIFSASLTARATSELDQDDGAWWFRCSGTPATDQDLFMLVEMQANANQWRVRTRHFSQQDPSSSSDMAMQIVSLVAGPDRLTARLALKEGTLDFPCHAIGSTDSFTAIYTVKEHEPIKLACAANAWRPRGGVSN